VKVLIVKLSAFGDIIHSLPALDDVLARPGVSEVHWLVDVRYQFVTEVFPPQVRVHTIDLKGKNRLSEVWRVVKALRAEKFDVALDLQGLMKSALLARLICSKVFGIDQKYMKEKYQRKSEIIYNGASNLEINEPKLIERFSLEKEKYILSVSRLIRHKGIHYLIKAF